MITPNADDRTIADDLADRAIAMIANMKTNHSHGEWFIDEEANGIEMRFRPTRDHQRNWTGGAYLSLKIRPTNGQIGEGVFYDFNRHRYNRIYTPANRLNAYRIRKVCQRLWERAQQAFAQLEPAQRLSDRVDALRMTPSEQAAIELFANKIGYPMEYETMTHDHIAAYNAWLDALEQQRKGTNQ